MPHWSSTEVGGRWRLGEKGMERPSLHIHAGERRCCALQQVSRSKGEDLAREYDIPFIETSAKGNINVEEAFMWVWCSDSSPCMHIIRIYALRSASNFERLTSCFFPSSFVVVFPSGVLRTEFDTCGPFCALYRGASYNQSSYTLMSASMGEAHFCCWHWGGGALKL